MPELNKDDIDDATLEQLLFGDEDEDGDEQDDDADDKDTDGDEDSDETPPEGWKPPTYAQWRKSNSKAKNWRLRATGKDPTWKYPGATTGNDEGEGAPEGDAKADVAELRKQIRAEVEQEFATKAEQAKVREAAVTSLVAAGVSLPEEPKKRAKAVAKLVKLLDLDEVTVDGDDIEGLDEQIEQMARDYPALFQAAGSGSNGNGRKPPRRRIGERSNGDDPETKDPLRQMAKQYFGNK